MGKGRGKRCHEKPFTFAHMHVFELWGQAGEPAENPCRLMENMQIQHRKIKDQGLNLQPSRCENTSLTTVATNVRLTATMSNWSKQKNHLDHLLNRGLMRVNPASDPKSAYISWVSQRKPIKHTLKPWDFFGEGGGLFPGRHVYDDFTSLSKAFLCWMQNQMPETVLAAAGWAGGWQRRWNISDEQAKCKQSRFVKCWDLMHLSGHCRLLSKQTRR